jgi:hypothetical protein
MTQDRLSKTATDRQRSGWPSAMRTAVWTLPPGNSASSPNHGRLDASTGAITAGATITSTFQAVHTSVQYSLGTPGPSVTRRIDILNASGDSFHAGCRWGV